MLQLGHLCFSHLIKHGEIWGCSAISRVMTRAKKTSACGCTLCVCWYLRGVASSVAICRGLVWGLGRFSLSFPSLQFSKCSREAVPAAWGMKNCRTACGLFFLSFPKGVLGLHTPYHGFPTVFNPVACVTTTEAGGGCLLFCPPEFETGTLSVRACFGFPLGVRLQQCFP